MAIFIGLLLGLISVLLLSLPILTQSRRGSISIAPLGSLDEIRQRRKQIYEEVQGLILDYELGNISNQDYRERLKAYRLHAAYILREEEQTQEALRRVEAELEDEILELRRFWGTVKDSTLCGWCGGEIDEDAVLCPRCVAYLPAVDFSLEKEEP